MYFFLIALYLFNKSKSFGKEKGYPIFQALELTKRILPSSYIFINFIGMSVVLFKYSNSSLNKPNYSERNSAQHCNFKVMS